ncbi:hypothetical protein SMICM17S_12564 [Streptomyces microflavus]
MLDRCSVADEGLAGSDEAAGDAFDAGQGEISRKRGGHSASTSSQMRKTFGSDGKGSQVSI